MILNRKAVVTFIYELTDDFYVDVSRSLNNKYYDFYLGHKSYGVKELMFGLMIDNIDINTERYILSNVNDYIEIYKTNYMED